MAKPIILEQIGKKWHVHVDVDAARRMAPSRVLKRSPVKDWSAGAIIPVVKTAQGKLGLEVGGAPMTFKTKGDAEHVAHMIGRYYLELGDFVHTYTEVIRGASGDRARRARRYPRRY